MEPQRPPDRAWRIWIGRLAWLIAGALLSAGVSFLSQGPDAIRKIPEIPDAVSETIRGTWQGYHIDRQLTDSWELAPIPGFEGPPVRLQIDAEKGKVIGELHSPVIRKWTIWDTAFIDGRREGRMLHLTVFDWIGGKRTPLAQLDVTFQAELGGEEPGLVDKHFTVETVWQIKEALPKQFVLHRVAK